MPDVFSLRADTTPRSEPSEGARAYSYFSPDTDVTAADTALLIEEIPLAILCNGVSHAVMMVSPLDLEDFVTGFALTEGLIERNSSLPAVSIRHQQQPLPAIHADIRLPEAQFRRFLQQQRSVRRGASGCGLCGSESFHQVYPDLSPLPAAPLPALKTLQQLRDTLSRCQQLGQDAGAIHAALLLSADGEPVLCREDIGRHNALDKVIGAAMQQSLELHGCSVVMSSRCSTELILKAVRSGLTTLIHLSAPSALAVELARRYNLNLIHLPRRDAARAYHLQHPQPDAAPFLPEYL